MQAAKVVDLPEPVGPVTSTSPLGRWSSSFNAGGVPNCSMLRLHGNLQHHPGVAAREYGYAEPRLVAEREPKVGPPLLLQFLLAPFGRDALHQRNGVLRLEHLGFELHKPAVKAQNRRLPHGDVQVAGATVDHREQQFIDQNRPHKLLPCAGASPFRPGTPALISGPHGWAPPVSLPGQYDKYPACVPAARGRRARA